jgi:serine/threonine protein kinase
METKTLAVGTWMQGRYRVTRLVAGGGMAWVYEVEEQLPGGGTHIWAMKELRTDNQDPRALEEGRRLFSQEADILIRLSHPNLPQMCASFEEAGHSYLVMEFIRGESLEKRLEHANAPIIEGQVLDWAVQICGVLAYLHSRQPPIIFRDLKPSNVMVTLDGRVKLIDFGIARTYKVGKLHDTINMGSENYAAPEQWGQTQTDPRADLYSMGATMYHLLTNVPPLPAFVPTPRVGIQQYNPAVSERTVAVVERAMAKNREDRFASAVAMRDALLECLPKTERRLLEARLQQWQAAPTPASAAVPRPVVPIQRVAAPEARPVPTRQDLRPASPSVTTAPPAASPMPTPPALSTPVPQPYAKPCPSCGTLNRPASRFCRHCGYVFVPPLPPVLRVVEPRGARWEFPLREGAFVIGRPGGTLPVDLDIAFYDPDGFISRNHARVTVQQRRYYVADLGSANGTYVNNERLAPLVQRSLRDGDQVRMGQVVLQFRLR